MGRRDMPRLRLGTSAMLERYAAWTAGFPSIAWVARSTWDEMCWDVAFMPWIIVAWFAIALYESASLIFLNPRTFGWGPRIWSLTPPALKPPMGLELGAIHSTASGKFRFVTPRRCVFSRRYGWFTTEVVTPFAIKGTIHWNEKGAFVEGRIAITPIIFFAYWITDWTLACLQDMGSEPLVALMMLLLGWGFVVGGYKWSRTLEIKRAMAVLEEIGQWQSASDRSWSAMSK